MTYAPKGFSTLTPVIITENAKATIESYKNALDANIGGIMECPQTGMVMHACLNIRDSTIFVSDKCPDMGINTTERQEFYLYVENTDNALKQAKNNGWKELSEAEDMFWGDRIATVKDIDGNTWKLAQKVREVSEQEITEAINRMGEKS